MREGLVGMTLILPPRSIYKYVTLYTSELQIPVGQNSGMDENPGPVNWGQFITDFHAEVQYYVFGVGSNVTGRPVAHYTQVSNAMSKRFSFKIC